MRKGLYFKFILILLLAGAVFYIALPAGSKISLKWARINFEKQFKLNLGLDLQGGTHLVYEGNLKDIPQDARADAMNSARDVIERRVNAFGVSEPLVQVSGTDRIIIELPGVKDIDEAIKLIGQTPFLEFRVENPNPPEVTPDVNGEVTISADQAFIPTGLTGKEFKRASLEFDQRTGVPQISLHFPP